MQMPGASGGDIYEQMKPLVQSAVQPPSTEIVVPVT